MLHLRPNDVAQQKIVKVDIIFRTTPPRRERNETTVLVQFNAFLTLFTFICLLSNSIAHKQEFIFWAALFQMIKYTDSC